MPLRFTLRQLEYFVAVGQCGSIAGASDKLNVSSPSISAAIAQLEAELGLSLFVRKHAHGLSQTTAGARLLEHSEKILLTAGELNDLAGEISGNVQGPLRLGCLLTFAQVIAPRVRREFEAEYPEVTIRQYELNQVDIFSRIRRAELDVALTYELDIPSDLEFVPLLGLSPYVIVSPEHPLAHLDEITVEDLKDHAMILLDLPHSSEYFLSFFKSQGQRPKIAERTHDMAVMRSLVANGFGYSIANIRPLNDESPDGGKLKLIPLVGDVRPLNMGLLMAKGADTSITVRAFTSHCEDMIKAKKLPGLT
ncbi:HTH-type transcriptional regulator CynR [Roseovarius albus]|uniref:HTH-type transcriptional regulator CynR n=1 Tax=Roseovarius albus TaxID=1247867 RepID=A0A1X6ZNW6_9RHOB|nr:LysR family transcriptional regulator [Roseovarius albus]SLN55236.1 HTH-type transcriptional regulator CynR [Roseovarius albus]